ncbi:hypothetical protein C7M84_021203 [Penaeus vannamei]|uniref:Uncharacterized protein n=1 Tax=Penaeus vannamei TaxID=6689 RepID=A0A3R7LWF9_PENVA|nr:hypothetical protein C7M84_021203 [Penaeus vannamei]
MRDKTLFAHEYETSFFTSHRYLKRLVSLFSLPIPLTLHSSPSALTLPFPFLSLFTISSSLFSFPSYPLLLSFPLLFYFSPPLSPSFYLFSLLYLPFPLFPSSILPFLLFFIFLSLPFLSLSLFSKVPTFPPPFLSLSPDPLSPTFLRLSLSFFLLFLCCPAPFSESLPLQPSSLSSFYSYIFLSFLTFLFPSPLLRFFSPFLPTFLLTSLLPPSISPPFFPFTLPPSLPPPPTLSLPSCIPLFSVSYSHTLYLPSPLPPTTLLPPFSHSLFASLILASIPPSLSLPHTSLLSHTLIPFYPHIPLFSLNLFLTSLPFPFLPVPLPPPFPPSLFPTLRRPFLLPSLPLPSLLLSFSYPRPSLFPSLSLPHPSLLSHTLLFYPPPHSFPNLPSFPYPFLFLTSPFLPPLPPSSLPPSLSPSSSSPFLPPPAVSPRDGWREPR